jgi:hypothetical protein
MLPVRTFGLSAPDSVAHADCKSNAAAAGFAAPEIVAQKAMSAVWIVSTAGARATGCGVGSGAELVNVTLGAVNVSPSDPPRYATTRGIERSPFANTMRTSLADEQSDVTPGMP